MSNATRVVIVTCEDGSRHEARVDAGDRLRITASGNVRLIAGDGAPGSIRQMDSPAVSLHELVKVSE